MMVSNPTLSAIFVLSKRPVGDIRFDTITGRITASTAK
jgi:hypothetical protein